MKGKPAKHILAALAGAALLSGCTRETEPLAPVVLTAVLEQADTRTAYDGVQGKLTWTEGDQVAVHVGNSYQTAEITPSDGHLAVSETASAYRNHYAVYPASAADAANYGNSTLKVNLPASYDISDIVSGASATRTADFSPCPMVAVNDTDDSILRFHHVGGLLRITCNGIPAGTRSLKVTVDGGITGTFAVGNPSTDQPSISAAAETTENNHVVFTIAGSGGLASKTNGVVLNVPVPCGDYNTYHLEAFASADGTGPALYSTMVSESHTFARHHGWKLPLAEVLFTIDGLSPVTLTYQGGEANLATSLRSFKTVDGVPEAVPYKLQYSSDGTTWEDTPPSWFSVATPASGFAGSVTGEELGLSVDAQVNSAPDLHRAAMLAKTPYVDDPKDLSTINVATGETVDCSTANCYVVDRPGNYKFPLVYGNGMQKGSWNPDAFRGKIGAEATDYRPDDGGENLFLGRFKDHLDNYIMDPWITTQHSGKAMDATLVWTEVPGLVDNVSVNEGEGYLTFQVPAETITQGNALVALLVDDDDDGTPETIAWSWHIWVTDVNLTQLKDSYSASYKLSPANLGWVDAKSLNYLSRTYYVRAVQTVEGGSSSARVLVQETAYNTTGYGSGLYYQFGRKDPFLASNRNYYDATNRSFSFQRGPTGTVSLGKAISNPFTFYSNGGGGSSEWCAPAYKNRWNAAQKTVTDNTQLLSATIKSVYDPSPVGFKVSPPGTFPWGGQNVTTVFKYTSRGGYLDLNTNGSQDSNEPFLSADGGLMWNTTMNFSDVGSFGAYRTSCYTSYDRYAYFGFSSRGAWPTSWRAGLSAERYWATALSVQPVKDSSFDD